MILDIDYHSGLPIYRQIIDQVAQQVLSGELPPGQQLETVRDLAGRLKVNPMTVSKAYSQLESEGLLLRRRGIGLFVAEALPAESDKKKNELFISIANKAAVMAAQMGINKNDAIAIFRDCLTQMDNSNPDKTESEGNNE